ncbi:MAG: beta-galactosidase, partial [Candidatus Pacebacteria bacterium]|nr:beta-galactosidase [Candidatus Paceibacterota bacterium]
MNPVPAGIPVAAGPVVLLCQVTQRQDNVRDAAELMQRNLGEFRTVIYDEEMDSAVRAQFQESLRGARLLCLDVGGWEALSESDRDDLRQRVEAGLDLMLTAPGKSALADLQERFGKPDWTPVSELWPGLRLETMTDVTMWRQSVGRGRVGVVRFPREAGVHFLVPHLGDRVIYNHGILATYAAMREVSGIKVPIRIVDIALTEPVEWESKGLTVPVSLQSAKSFQGTLDGYATNDRGRVVASARTELDAGEGDHTVELTLGPLPAGKYTVYAQVRGADATAVGVEIISPATLTIEPSQSLFSSEDPIQAALRVENAGEGDRLLVSVTDAWEREVARRDVPADTTDISLPAPLPRSRYQEVHATLMREGAPLRTSYAVVYRRLPHPLDEFQLFLWSGAHDRWWRNMHDARHAELGQNCAFSPGSGASYVRAAMKKNFELFSITHTAPRKKSPTQLADFASPEYLEENRKTLMEFAKESDALGGQWAFSHGDELFVRGWVPEVRDVSSGPAHDAFLRYLQDVYDNDIGSLNRAWGTAFASFEALEIPGDIDVPKEPRAPWLDYCFFLEDACCGYFERLNSSVNEHYPDARFGIDGIEKFSCFDGINWPRLQASQDVMIIYPHIDHDNKLFSWRAGIDFRRPGTVGGFWMSYDSDAVPAVAGSYPWMALFHGLNSIGFFHSYATHDWYAALQHDWRPTPKYAAATASIREIQDGPDKLLLNATVEYSPIAIHYSSRSLALSFPSSGVEAHINKLGVRNSYRTRKSGYIGHTANAGSAFMNLLADAGHKPRFVSTEQIEDGALDNYKVLVLPLSQSLTDAEVKAIETFVRGGGLLLAD